MTKTGEAASGMSGLLASHRDQLLRRRVLLLSEAGICVCSLWREMPFGAQAR
jgi:hypothetical protein